MYDVHETEVLIVGGGLVGLSAALFLEWHGVPAVLVEKRDTTSPQPKARRINLRTMELFRQVDAEADVMAAAAALADFEGMAAGRTLVEAEPLSWGHGEDDPAPEISPSDSCLCAQDTLEPVLRALATERGADLRFGHRVLEVVDDGTSVTSTVRDPDGRVGAIRARYLIAADGAHSPIRERLGIARSGRGTLGRSTNVYFEADLSAQVRGREFNLCQIEHPEVPSMLLTVDGVRRWLLMADPAPGRDHAGWARAVRTATGVPDLDVRILSALDWEPGMFVADRFSAGRIFLAGDAAHVMPPYLAAGANTGIQDVHNLAWKLARVVSGTAPRSLLDSYQVERHWLGWLTADQASAQTANLRQLGVESGDGTPSHDPVALLMGYQYPAGAFVPDGSLAPLDRLGLTGQPGSRLPHHRLGPDRSALDLVGRGLTLLGASDTWERAASATPGVEHRRVDDPAWAASVGITGTGALLVRPDHVIAWRCPTAPRDPADTLPDVVAAVLSGRG
ncbi:FAD-dependent monooxygenase [Actinoalloteichus caeruleus]|uniref:FAD-dependent monooxygenase n=1 Tax=Actinoalloteichus cyanogriseus TaxID=2893586 RepID=UPI003AB025AD